MFVLDEDPTTKALAKEVVLAAGKDHTPAELNEIRKIEDVMHTYFWCVDYLFWDVAEDIFAEKCAAIYNGVDSGVKTGHEMVEFLASHEGETIVPMHMSHNTVIVLTGENTARVLTKLNSHHFFTDSDRTYQAWGVYVNDFEKGADGRWRISTIRLTYRKRIGAKKDSSISNAVS